MLFAAALVLPNPDIAHGSSWASGPTRGAIELERTPLGVWIVAARLNGRLEGRFLLDTGATWCAVTSRTAARLRLVQVGEQIQMQTANGFVPMPLVRIRTVDVGGRRSHDVQAVILPQDLGDLDGIIGMNFLNEFVYSIDPRRSVLRLD